MASSDRALDALGAALAEPTTDVVDFAEATAELCGAGLLQDAAGSEIKRVPMQADRHMLSRIL
jgi:hypothetical protein